MKIAQVQFTPWDKIYYFSQGDIQANKGDKVIVKTELGTEIGEVVGFTEADDNDVIDDSNKEESQESKDNENSKQPEKKDETAEIETDKTVIKPIIRKATVTDLGKTASADDKSKALSYAIKSKERLELPMKIIDTHFAFDGSRVTFAFIADGRVDFREMVKDLTRHFGRTIRLQQIGIRDEAKIMGDSGHCGRGLCCKGHLKNLTSITSEMAELQQCSHRGSERISGVCGRLMCCLAYEQAGYEELAQGFPALGSDIKVSGKTGKVIGFHTLKQTVDVEFGQNNGDARTIAEVDIKKREIIK